MWRDYLQLVLGTHGMIVQWWMLTPDWIKLVCAHIVGYTRTTSKFIYWWRHRPCVSTGGFSCLSWNQSKEFHKMHSRIRSALHCCSLCILLRCGLFQQSDFRMWCREIKKFCESQITNIPKNDVILEADLCARLLDWQGRTNMFRSMPSWSQ